MEQLINSVMLKTDATENEKDLITLYVEETIDELEEVCGKVDIPASLISQIVVIKYQRKGTESISSSNYAGNGESYFHDYPPNIVRRIERLKKSNRRLRTL